MPKTPAQVQYEQAKTLSDRRDSLFARLEEGYGRIERGLDEGRDITTWEDLWLRLLDEYEAVCEQLQRELAG